MRRRRKRWWRGPRYASARLFRNERNGSGGSEKRLQHGEGQEGGDEQGIPAHPARRRDFQAELVGQRILNGAAPADGAQPRRDAHVAKAGLLEQLAEVLSV